MSYAAALPNSTTVAEQTRKTVNSKKEIQSRYWSAPSWWPPIHAFNASEQIILRSARRLSAIYSAVPFQPSNIEQMRAEIINSVGSGFSVSLAIREGRRAAEQLEMILQAFCCAGYRPLMLRSICEYRISPDERFLLSFIAGCQREDLYNIRSILSWLVPSVSVPHLVAPGQVFASILKDSGIALPQRLHLSSNGFQSRPMLPDHAQASQYH